MYETICYALYIVCMVAPGMTLLSPRHVIIVATVLVCNVLSVV